MIIRDVQNNDGDCNGNVAKQRVNEQYNSLTRASSISVHDRQNNDVKWPKFAWSGEREPRAHNGLTYSARD